MRLQQPSKHGLGNLLTLLGYVGVNADVEVYAVEVVGAGDVVEKVGEPKEIVLVAYHPVEIDP